MKSEREMTDVSKMPSLVEAIVAGIDATYSHPEAAVNHLTRVVEDMTAGLREMAEECGEGSASKECVEVIDGFLLRITKSVGSSASSALDPGDRMFDDVL